METPKRNFVITEKISYESIMPKRKFYSKDFKVEVFKLITEHGYKPTEAGQRLGISASAISNWKRELEGEGTRKQLSLAKVI